MIETVSGQPVHRFFQDRIFEPLEMTRSRAFTPDDKFQLNERVYGFVYAGEDHVDNDWNFLNGMIGDGGLYASKTKASDPKTDHSLFLPIV